LKDRPLALQKYREYAALTPPPPDRDAVKELAHALEVELNPPARLAATSPAVANMSGGVPSRSTASNAVTARAPQTTQRPAQSSSPVRGTEVSAALARASNSRPAQPSPPVQQPAPNTEVVMLTPEPAIKPAQDVSSRPAGDQAVPAPAMTASSPATDGAQTNDSHRGFLQHINPMNLFHGQPKPQAGAAQTTSAQGAAPSTATTDQSSPGALPRYSYLSPAPPAMGDRAKAERAFAQGAQAQQSGRFADAVQAFRQATQLDPSYYEAQYDLGLAAAAAGKSSEALRAYEMALAIRPESLDARYNFALLLQQSSFYLDAADEFEKILAKAPDEARANLALGNLYAQQLHQPAKARACYLKVLEIDPHHTQADAIRHWLLANQP
jgi:Flp pilus assembly protein TadD